MRPSREVLNLISLLDDEDEAVAVDAMAELLDRREELHDLPALLQESDDPRVRRRIHQLEAALTLRRRRTEFFRRLESRNVDLAAGLIAIHLQWFDNDSQPEIARMYQEFCARLNRRPAFVLTELAAAMGKLEFAAEKESTLHPENYCLGTVLGDRIGSGAVICALLKAAVPSGRFQVGRLADEFVLCDAAGGLLVPTHNFLVLPAQEGWKVQMLSDRELLRYLMTMLFCCAVNSDSFRYVLTIAQALTGAEDDLPLDYLPYPYRPDGGETLENPEQPV